MRTILPISASLLITIPLTTAQPQLQYSNSFGLPDHSAIFDYVIVGGGTAGLAIAYRLAEDGTKTVAVVEAGGFYEQESGNTSVVPAYNQEIQLHHSGISVGCTACRLVLFDRAAGRCSGSDVPLWEGEDVGWLVRSRRQMGRRRQYMLTRSKLGAERNELQQTHYRQSTSMGRCGQRYKLYLGNFSYRSSRGLSTTATPIPASGRPTPQCRICRL
jgi:hypothetical protein